MGGVRGGGASGGGGVVVTGTAAGRVGRGLAEQDGFDVLPHLEGNKRGKLVSGSDTMRDAQISSE